MAFLKFVAAVSAKVIRAIERGTAGRAAGAAVVLQEMQLVGVGIGSAV